MELKKKKKAKKSKSKKKMKMNMICKRMRCSFLPTCSTLEMEGDDEYDALYKFLYEHVYPANINEKDKKRAFRRKASGYKVERGRLFYYHKSSKSWKQVPSE
eukprot:Em0007g542a